MSWTDKSAIKTILQLRDEFDIKEFVETGTFKGINAKLHSLNFDLVYTCEINKTYFLNTANTFPSNVISLNMDSSKFLTVFKIVKKLRKGKDNIPFFYLDAHFYDASLPKEKRFVVLEELKALENFGDCIIAIHDFDCEGLGHIIYDGVSLNFDLVKERLLKVNSNFNFYVNTRDYCNILTIDDVKNKKVEGIEYTPDVIDSLKYVWSSPEKTYRGILYSIPKEIDLSKYCLKKLEKDD